MSIYLFYSGLFVNLFATRAIFARIHEDFCLGRAFAALFFILGFGGSNGEKDQGKPKENKKAG
jgi:hypothetical protein